jgi:hypothetical protein
MKLLILGAVIGATLLGALPASAEVVVRERVVVGDRDHDRDGWRRESWRRHHAECRTVRERITTPRGRVIIKTHRTCE